jgi:O-antigen/teichoic acid export membrane protein
MNPRAIFKSELIRNTSVLVTGTVLAQLISVLLQPLLRRLYSAEMWGTYSVYMSLVGIIAVISSLRYDDAIVLPRKDKDSANLLALSLFFNLCITFLFFLIFLLFGKQILHTINLKPGFTSSVLYLIPLGAFLYNVAQSFNYWLIRKKRYTGVSANKLVRRGSEGLSQVTLALVKNPAGLILSDIIGQTANVVSTVIQSLSNEFSFKLLSKSKLSYVAGKYSEFPRYNLIPSLMSTCSFFLPPVFINKFFSAESAGYFDLTKMVLSIPMAFVASSISSVLLQKIADSFNAKKSFLPDLKSTLLVVIAISLAESVVIALFGIPLFKIVFGQNWGISGEISRIMVWSFVLNFIVSSFSCIFISMRKIKYYSIWQLFYFVSIISLLLFRNLEFREFLKVYVLIEVVCYFTVLTMMFRIVKNYEKNLTQAKNGVTDSTIL